MTGILVFTNKEVLEHKKRDGKFSDGNECWWEVSRFPKQKVDRIYIAIKGQIKGYFKIELMDNERKELVFDSDSWTEIKDGETLKPSQGWRYYDGS